MDLTALRYLEAVAGQGSLSSAARALKVAQPTLTLAMRNLEKRFATTLLVSSRNGGFTNARTVGCRDLVPSPDSST